MKKNILFITVLLFALSGFSQKENSGFLIKCNIANLTNGMVKLVVKNKDELITVDSANSVNGKFTFKGKVKQPRLINIIFADNKTAFHFFVENKVITINGDFAAIDKVTITGSNTQSEYEQNIATLMSFDVLFKDNKAKLMDAQAKNNLDLVHQYDSLMHQNINDQLKSLYDVAFYKNKSVVTPYFVYTIMLNHSELNILDSIVNNFDKSIESDEYVSLLKEKLLQLHSTEIGKVAPEIEMTDENGVVFKLSSLRGKVVLIDFWAGWCRPCRAENPNVVAAFAKYKDKGFDVLGVSLDKDKDSWLKAIKDDKLTWHHVSDLMYWNNAAAKLYNINSVPHSILIDKDGKILAHNLRGEELLKKLAEVLH